MTKGDASSRQSDRRRKRVVLPKAEALRRLDVMVARVDKDLKIALAAEAALESGNSVVTARPRMRVAGANTYNTISQALMLNLAMSLAKLFDGHPRRKLGSSRHPNKRDIASLPLMVRLLKQRRCQNALVERARTWTPQFPDLEAVQIRACQRAINAAVRAYTSSRSSHSERSRQNRLKVFRDKLAAHTLITDDPQHLPKYSDLFELARVAQNVTSHAKLAIEGVSVDFETWARLFREEADEFWKAALRVRKKD